MGIQIKEAPLMQIRKHRGSLSASMETMKTIPATLAAVKEYIQETSSYLPFTQEELDSVVVKPYSANPDTRIGWEQTYVVMYRPRNSELNSIYAMCDQKVLW